MASVAKLIGGGGALVVSLDFELRWGDLEAFAREEYRENLLGVRRAIPEMLRLFAEHGIHATWATVGFLFFSGRDELLANLPDILPDYTKKGLSPYPLIAGTGNSEEEDPLHYAPSLIEQIAVAPHQEIATHTFSHYYCLEDGQTGEAFRADLRAARRIAREKGIELRSLIFPRNQFNEKYLSICADEGIVAYRGNQRSWIYRASTSDGESCSKRVVRLADAYVNLSGHNGHEAAVLGKEPPFDIPASRFLRPASQRAAGLEWLRLQRIKNEMSHAARNGLLYHLWWHPHNFGANTDINIAFLRRVLMHYQELRERYGMESLNMREMAERQQKLLVS